jgi:hypothetical protein
MGTECHRIMYSRVTVSALVAFQGREVSLGFLGFLVFTP